MSNLLERLHASFFLYIMSTPSSFLKIGSYLPSAVLIAAALMFGGLREWVSAGWMELEDQHPFREKGKDADVAIASKKRWVPRRRDLLGAFVVTAASHLFGLALFVIISQAWCDIRQLVCSLVSIASYRLLMFSCQSFIILPTCWITLTLAPWKFLSSGSSVQSAPFYMALKAINMCLASTLISVSSVLNFSLAALLAVTLGVPLSLASPSVSLHLRGVKCALYTTLALGWLAFEGEVKQAIWDWQVLGVWFSPLVCIVYVPFVLQAGIVSSLSP